LKSLLKASRSLRKRDDLGEEWFEMAPEYTPSEIMGHLRMYTGLVERANGRIKDTECDDKLNATLLSDDPEDNKALDNKALNTMNTASDGYDEFIDSIMKETEQPNLTKQQNYEAADAGWRLKIAHEFDSFMKETRKTITLEQPNLTKQQISEAAVAAWRLKIAHAFDSFMKETRKTITLEQPNLTKQQNYEAAVAAWRLKRGVFRANM
jgi:hypothetical protein